MLMAYFSVCDPISQPETKVIPNRDFDHFPQSPGLIYSKNSYCAASLRHMWYLSTHVTSWLDACRMIFDGSYRIKTIKLNKFKQQYSHNCSNCSSKDECPCLLFCICSGELLYTCFETFRILKFLASSLILFIWRNHLLVGFNLNMQ